MIYSPLTKLTLRYPCLYKYSRMGNKLHSCNAPCTSEKFFVYWRLVWLHWLWQIIPWWLYIDSYVSVHLIAVGGTKAQSRLICTWMSTLQQVFLTALSCPFSKDGYFNSNKARCEEKRFFTGAVGKVSNKQNKTNKQIYIYIWNACMLSLGTVTTLSFSFWCLI